MHIHALDKGLGKGYERVGGGGSRDEKDWIRSNFNCLSRSEAGFSHGENV
jgi:hypothetical protein